ncbi:hypothetical protein UFOVP121_41 [uncultured Caudovirales phage]|uniref:Uncharacterized protein n=1 Tax=uncultured Caudovirales phage TaxID=2100421 RepID=A0A6J5LA69_9CAUD|nr:hypothetical protein UFOVP121_41 [uncultured Caudovirales phage]CAB4134996.1 hypothetical protein UFOVP277_46 [uncultured Caudovirales phage]
MTIEVIQDGTTLVLASPSGSKTIQVVSRGPQGAGGAKGYFGSFYDTSTQTAAAAQAAKTLAMNTTAEAFGISIDVNNGIVFSEAGTYSLTFSLQLANTDNAVGTVDVWVDYNGTAFPDSSTRFDVPARKGAGSPGHTVATVNYVATAVEGGVVKIKWRGSSTDLSIYTIAADSYAPRTPSVILTVVQVMNIQAGPEGPAGAGVPVGGTSGQALVKASSADRDTSWATLFSGGLAKIEVVSDLPASPDATTLYIVTT